MSDSVNFSRSNSESTTRSERSPSTQKVRTRSNSNTSHTPTLGTNSEDRGTRSDKETDHDTPPTKDEQLCEQHPGTERPSNTRTYPAGMTSPRHDKNHKISKDASTAMTRKQYGEVDTLHRRYAKACARSGNANPQHYTVTLTEAPTLYPATELHATIVLDNSHIRRYPAGAHPAARPFHPSRKPHTLRANVFAFSARARQTKPFVERNKRYCVVGARRERISVSFARQHPRADSRHAHSAENDATHTCP